MAKRIAFTFRSCADLNDIWESIATPSDVYGSASSDNLSAAEEFADKFEQMCNLLPSHPEIGLNRDDLHPGVRSIPFQRYAIFYRTRGNAVEVLRVLRAPWDAHPGVFA